MSEVVYLIGRRYLDLIDEVLDDYPEDANDGVGTGA
jgi:hypothetical protein